MATSGSFQRTTSVLTAQEPVIDEVVRERVRAKVDGSSVGSNPRSTGVEHAGAPVRLVRVRITVEPLSNQLAGAFVCLEFHHHPRAERARTRSNRPASRAGTTIVRMGRVQRSYSGSGVVSPGAIHGKAPGTSTWRSTTVRPSRLSRSIHTTRLSYIEEAGCSDLTASCRPPSL